jgi:hypothetical protein
MLNIQGDMMSGFQRDEIEGAVKAEKPLIGIVVPDKTKEEKEAKFKSLLEKFKTATEKELCDIKFDEMVFPETEEQLLALIRALLDREHDYGTCVYAMSFCALSAFHYASAVLGSTGFQASCADLDFLRRSRWMENGFRIVDYNNLLYPQYYFGNEKFPDKLTLLMENLESLQEAVRKKMREGEDRGWGASPGVLAHWNWILSLRKEMK